MWGAFLSLFIILQKNNPFVKKIKLKKNSQMPLNQSMNINKLKKILV